MAALKPLTTDKLILRRLFSASFEKEVLTGCQDVGGKTFLWNPIGWQPPGSHPACPAVQYTPKLVSAFDLVSVSLFLNFGLYEFIVPHKKEHRGSMLGLKEPERVLSVLAHPGFEPSSLFVLRGPPQWFPHTFPLAEV